MELPFETALTELEQIVKQLEHGDLALEEALNKFAEGVKLSQVCLSKLSSAEKQLDVMIEELNGKISEQPLIIQED
jgi:exodeoxyribonuclease VII small subunit